MKTMKKTIALLLTLMMLLSLGCFTSFADGEGTGEQEVKSVTIYNNEVNGFYVGPPDSEITVVPDIIQSGKPLETALVTIDAPINNPSADGLVVDVSTGDIIINVNGGVTGDSDGIDAKITGGITEINVEGNVEGKASTNAGISASTKTGGQLAVNVGRTDEKGDVIVSGDVMSAGTGIKATNYGDMEINVTGGVTGTGNDGINATNITGKMTVNVGGSVSGGGFGIQSTNIDTDTGSITINVGKDVEGSIDSDNSGTTSIQVGGNVTGIISATNYNGSTTISIAGSVTEETAKTDGINIKNQDSIKQNSNNQDSIKQDSKNQNSENQVTVTVGGNVTGAADGVEVENLIGSTDINIKESVEGKSGDGIRVKNSNEYLNEGDSDVQLIKDSRGEEVTVTVGGSVTGAEDGIEIQNDTGIAAVTVAGDVTAEKAGIKLESGADNTDSNIKTTVEVDGILNAGETPILIGEGITEKNVSITVWSVEVNDQQAKDGEIVKADSKSTEEKANAVENNIRYIIKVGESGKDYKGLSFVNAEKGESGYYAAKAYDETDETEDNVVTLKIASEYKLLAIVHSKNDKTSRKDVIVQDNDGNYKLLIPKGGGVWLELSLEKIEAPATEDYTIYALGTVLAKDGKSLMTIFNSRNYTIAYADGTNEKGSFRFADGQMIFTNPDKEGITPTVDGDGNAVYPFGETEFAFSKTVLDAIQAGRSF
ncbi:MAG: hypothetical protein IKS55_14510 [Oscillospiraceae bacterium]|nr:hypothetical protein [Oscillospiraceae bacterium]